VAPARTRTRTPRSSSLVAIPSELSRLVQGFGNDTNSACRQIVYFLGAMKPRYHVENSFVGVICSCLFESSGCIFTSIHDGAYIKSGKTFQLVIRKTYIFINSQETVVMQIKAVSHHLRLYTISLEEYCHSRVVR
jgi:hypothetical protein